MPSKNSIKKYLSNGYYHIYNRGVEKRKIFQDEQDYGVFLSYLKSYLLPKKLDELQSQLSRPSISWPEKDKILKMIRLNNFSDEIKLMSYCLMPNHFHFLVKQFSPNSIDVFMNSLGTRYVMYFNRKYERVGPLYQGVYKAVFIETDEQLTYLSAYIHRNPLELFPEQIPQGDALQKILSQPSSFPEYLKMRDSRWVDTRTILSFFSKANKGLSYESFLFGKSLRDSLINYLKID